MSGTSVYYIFFVMNILKFLLPLVSMVIIYNETPFYCRRLRYLFVFRILF
jgi:hypothetical protein